MRYFILLVVSLHAGEMHCFVINLIEKHRPTVRLSRQGSTFLTNPSVLAMAYIIVILRLLFQLDDIVEK